MEPGKRLLGKVAIVTGGASGIGAATARLFAQHGASVVLTDSNASLGKTVATEITSAGGTAAFTDQDVRNEAQWAAIVAQAEKAYGRVDILCNIAGISGRDPKLNVQTGNTAGPRLAEQTLEQWNWVMEINATGVFLGTKAAVPAMMRAGGGSIINISSVAGTRWTGVPYSAYYASKAALVHLTRTTAVEYASKRVRVNAILPGLMQTPMIEHSPSLAKSYANNVEEMWRVRAAQVPMGIGGEAWDVAWGAVYLASEEAKYVTGIELVIDGGVSLK